MDSLGRQSQSCADNDNAINTKAVSRVGWRGWRDGERDGDNRDRELNKKKISVVTVRQSWSLLAINIIPSTFLIWSREECTFLLLSHGTGMQLSLPTTW